VIFVVTIGEALENEVSQLTKEGSILKASVLDTVGSVEVEKVADWLESMIRDVAAANGAKVSWRYSPGYCDWDITQQKELFRGLDGKSVGVSLTDTCLMVPRKSISGVIGMGESCNTFSACRFCNRKNCPERREEFAP
jgi:cobalamin-dependent methionine synthase I